MASSPWIDHATPRTQWLPFSEHVSLTALRLSPAERVSPAERGRGGGVELNNAKHAKCSHLWPSSVFKHSPADGFQILTVLSSLPLASSPWIDHATDMTQLLPFS